MERTISAIRRLIPACVLVGALALPTVAAGKTHSLSGMVGGDANAIVSMKVKVNSKNKPKKVKDFAWQGLDGFCDDTFAGEKSGALSGVANSTRVDFGGFFRTATSTPAESVDISGTVKRRGKKIVNGSIVVYNGFCSAPPLGSRGFTATK